MIQVELLIPTAQPLHAWRVFSVGVDGDQIRLFPTASTPNSLRPWQAEERATCSSHQAAPAADCRCGLYGVTGDLQEALAGYKDRRSSHTLVFAEIALSGRAFVDFRAVRAEQARVLQIVVPEKLLITGFELGEPERMLTDYYGATIVGVEALPEWVTVWRYYDHGRPLPEWVDGLAVPGAPVVEL